MVKFKKVFAIFVSVILFAVCGFLTGCGNKYKKLSWEISYSFTEGENKDWQKVEGNNLELFFGKDAKLVSDENGNLNKTMYLRVKVNGVKAKDLGQVILTNAGSGAFNGSGVIPTGQMVNSGQYIDIQLNLTSNERLDTKLNFREVNSGKSTNLGLIIAPTLTGMEMNINNLTPVVVGGSAKLDAFNAINYLPIGSTQRGAKFSFDGQVGYYVLNDDGTTTFKSSDTTDTSKISVSENGTITVPSDYNLSSQNYVIRVKATSIVNPEISCYVDAYVVSSQTYNLALNYNNANGNGAPVGNGFTLYPQMNENGTNKYNAVDLKLSQAGIGDNIYYSGVQTANPNVRAQYKLNVYLNSTGNTPYNLDTSDWVDGIKISRLRDGFHVEADSSARTNGLTFKFELDGLNTHGDDVPTFSVSSEIAINYLPTKISTDLIDDNPETPEIDTTIYNTQNTIYSYFNLDLNSSVKELQILDANSNFELTGGSSTTNGNATTTTILDGTRVGIRFRGDADEGRLVVRARCVPQMFAGEQVFETAQDDERYITLTLNVKKVVTASRVEAYANMSTSISSSELDGAINLSTNNGVNSAYIKVYYQSGAQQFDETSVQLISNNQHFKFVNGNTTSRSVKLSDLVQEEDTGTENGLNFIWYKLTFATENVKNLETGTISVVVGGNRVELGTDSTSSFVVRNIIPTSGNLTISTKRSDNNIKFLDRNFTGEKPQVDGKQTVNFAVAVSSNIAEFNVEDERGFSRGIKSIRVVPHNVASSTHFSNSALNEITPSNTRAGNNFSFRVVGAYTQLLDVEVQHYVVDTDNNIIILKTSTVTAQFAGYNPIKSIAIDPQLDLDNLRLAYKEGFEEASKLSINFYSADANATKEIYFLGAAGEIKVENVNDLGVYYENSLYKGTGDSAKDLIDDCLSLQVSKNSDLNKTATLTLKTDTLPLEMITLTLVPTRFDTTNLSAGREIQVKIVGFDESSSLALSVDGMRNDNIYISFIDGEDVSFDINAVVGWQGQSDSIRNGKLSFRLYKYQQDENGDLRYTIDHTPILDDITDFSNNITISDFEFEKQTASNVLIGKSTFTAHYLNSNQGGGIFKLVVGTVDSYDKTTKSFANSYEITINIGDGSLQNKFTISNKDDFAKINNALNAHYSLVNDIYLDENFTPIGAVDGAVQMFTGSLDGKSKTTLNGQVLEETHSITYTLDLSKAQQYSYNDSNVYVAGLFAVVGRNTVNTNLDNITNLNVFVQFKNLSDDSLSTEQTDYAVGALAGLNWGRIKNVNVTISSDINLGGAEQNSNTVAFGGYFGRNYGRVDVRGAIVKTDRPITISSKFKTNNLGMIVGENLNAESEILGDFNASNLAAMQYNVNAAVTIQKTGSTEATFNVGAVVGNISAGEIDSVLVCGKIEFEESSSTANLGGIAGSATGATIKDCASFGLSLTNKANAGAVAGVVAASTGGNTITHTKVVFGTIVGTDELSTFTATNEDVKVAGILVSENAGNSNDNISYSSVETISNKDGYHLNGNIVAGISFGNVKVTNSFVNVNIKAKSVYLLTDNTTAANEANCYFLGKVDGTIAKKKYAETTENTQIDSTKNYAIVIEDDNKLLSAYTGKTYDFNPIDQINFFDAKTGGDLSTETNDYETYYVKNDDKFELFFEDSFDPETTYYALKDDWYTNVKSYIDDDDTNTIKEYNSEFDEFDASSQYFAVDLTDPNFLASEILSVVFNGDGIVNDLYADIWGIGDTNQIIVNKFTINLPYLKYGSGSLAIDKLQSMSISDINGDKTSKIYSTKVGGNHVTIINYHKPSDQESATLYETYNTYNILKTNDHDGLITLSTIPANTPIDFKIIDGGQFAQIVDGTKIKFTGISGNSPIRLRVYSQFDESKFEDAIFFTQYGVTELELSDKLRNSVHSINGVDGKEFVSALYYSNETKNTTGLEISVDAFNKIDAIHNALSIFDDKENLNKIQKYLSFNFVALDENANQSPQYVEFTQNAQTFIVTPNADALADAGTITHTKFEIDLMFNIQEYYKNETSESYFAEVGKIPLGSANITFNILQSANAVEVGNQNSEIAISSTAKIEASLYTTWVGNASGTTYTGVPVEILGNRLVLQEENKDSLYLDFEIVEGATEFENIKGYTGITNIPSWFKDNILVSYIKDDNRLIYNINLTVKNDFNYRRITHDVKIKIYVRAQSNEDKFDVVYLTIKPEQLKRNNIYMENYNITRTTPDDQYGNKINISSAETTYIEPGTSGGLMIIRLQPSYAAIDYDNIDLRSGYIETNQTQSGRAYIQFEQMVYDRASQTYYSYVNNRNIMDDTYGIIGKKLYPISERVDDGNGNVTHIYTGTIYVRMYLTLLVGTNQSIKVTLNVNSNGQTISQDKDLSTTFVPGVVPNFESGISVGNETVQNNAENLSFKGYLIEKSSYNNIITLKTYGYEYNGRPSIYFKKLTLSGETYTIGDNATDINYEFITDLSNPPTMDSDGAYTIRIRLRVGDIDYPFIMQTSLYLSVDGVSKQQNSSLIFHPTDFILTDLGIDNLNLNNISDSDIRLGSSGAISLNLGSSKEIKLNFTTTSNGARIDVLYAKLLREIGKKFEIDDTNDIRPIAKLFEVYINGQWLNLYEVVLDSSYDNLRIFDLTNESKQSNLVLQAKAMGKTNFRLNLDYYYSENEDALGTYSIHVAESDAQNRQLGETGRFSRTVIFTLIVNGDATEETPDAIYNENEFLSMREGGNYILMNDLVFENYSPFNVNVASFDGNNHTITIKSFVIDQNNFNYGLFANFDYHEDGNQQVKSTLKNVIVIYDSVKLDFEQYQSTNSDANIVFGGLVANLGEGGIVYNCDVFNRNTASKENVTIIMPNSKNATLTFGGLVGINDGIITNSRVGYDKYVSIRANNRGVVSTVTYTNSDLTFTLGDSEHKQFVGLTGGFVGVNNGHIASSFVANTNLYNYSANSDESLTAGFVANNSGTGLISYSYVKSKENSIQNNKAYATGTTIENRSSGNVAGFVHRNEGEISNSYANVEVKSDSTFIAGFVYENAQSGNIHECYAASTLNGGVATSDNPNETNRNAEQPFVGIARNGTVLSNGKMENVYYYDPETKLKQKTEGNKPKANALNYTNIQNSTFLHGFVFVLGNNSISERNQGVWAYYQYNTNNARILPELNTANFVAYSYRYFVTNQDNKQELHDAFNFERGGANNPYIIRDIKDFEQIFTSNAETKSFNGYVRFINNLDFDDSYTSKTSLDYTLGSAGAITSVEGNGMQINNVRLSTGTGGASVDEVGLFAKITNSYIKNLSINIGSSPNVGRTKYLGGLAGKIDDSVILNITLDSNNVELAGNNFVGGLAGMITGNSLIYGVQTNVSVKANVNRGQYAGMYYSEKDYQQMKNQLGNQDYETYLTGNEQSGNGLSYAGGLAGVIDLEKRGREDYNLSYITVDGPDSIVGDYAGGIAGYFGGTKAADNSKKPKIMAKKLKYYTKTTSSNGAVSGSVIHGYHTAGGIFAVTNGLVEAAQVTSIESEFDPENNYNQFKIDQAFDDYITTLENNQADASLDKNRTGNLSLINGGYYAGGLVGIALGADISSTYAKAGFDLTQSDITSSVVIGGLVGISFAANTNYSYAIPYLNFGSELNRDITAGGFIGKIVDVNSTTLSSPFERQLATYTKDVFKEENNTAQFTFSTLLKDHTIDIDNINGENTSTINYFATQNENLSNASNSMFVGKNKTIENTTNYENAEIKEEGLLDLFQNDLSTTTFDKIFNPFLTTGYWSLTWNRYFPLLLEATATNRRPISSATGEEGFTQLIADRDGDYKIIDDITIDGPLNDNPNYVLDINFTGSIISDKPDHSPAVVTIKNLKPTRNTTAGFFKNTTGAELNNIIFNWQPTSYDDENPDNQASVVVNGNIDVFGGVSAEDNGSLFNLIQVKSAVSDDSVGTMLKTGNSYNGTIAGFGGIVGMATNTKFVSCSFAGQVDANLNQISGSQLGNSVAVGGIFAQGKSTVGDGDEVDEDALSTSLTATNSTIKNNTLFKLAINRDLQAYVGLAFGSIDNGNIDGTNIADINELDNIYTTVTMPEIDLQATKVGSVYAGGVVGRVSQNAKIDNTEITAKIAIDKLLTNLSEANHTLAVGGLAGRAQAEFDGVTSSVDISVENTLVNSALLSNGVAFGEGVTITNAALTGDITAKNETNTITNIVAAGVVAENNENAVTTLDTVFAYPIIDVGTESTQSISMAGLVANNGTSTTISNAISAGRLMVDASNIEVNDDAKLGLYLGGIMANGKGNPLTVGATAVITTILTDGVKNSDLQDMENVHALFGGNMGRISVSVNAENVNVDSWVVYSSDFALVNDNTDKPKTTSEGDESGDDHIYNFEARKITSSTWLPQGENNFSIVSSGMPYLTNLAPRLELLGFLSGNSYSNNVKSTQFNPETFTQLSSETESDYKYYILGQNATISAQTNALNGVLLGNGTHEVNATNLNQSENGYAGLFPQILKHSAISNVHLIANENINVTASGYVGLLAGENLGVISNCSLNGTNVTLKANCNGFAGLVGNNLGMVAYCYSTIEIVDITGSVQNLAGLVLTNNGKMYANYFTGYINNDHEGVTTTAYGIVYNYNQGSYTYNNYMAGVITDVRQNSFGLPGGNLSGDLTDRGSKNFVDRYANAEQNNPDRINDEITNRIFTYVDTYQLMNAEGMHNNWHKILVERQTDSGEQKYSINQNATSFGYNYGYPVIMFNKVESFTSNECLDIRDYQLYTGNGSWDKNDSTLSTDNKVVGLTNRANKLLESTGAENKLYLDAYKIPHFGVLMSINALSNADLNFVLIYNMDGKISDNDLLNIYSAGGSDNPIAPVLEISQTNNFTGVVVSNRLYNLNAQTDLISDAITISNFAGNGLFTNIKNAYFGYLKFSGKFEIDGGVLGNTVTAGESATNSNNVIVTQVQFDTYNSDGTTEYTSINNSASSGETNTSAIFGSINTHANVQIGALTVSEGNNVVISASASTDGNNAYAGFVAGTNAGEITFTDTINLRVQFGINNFAGGLVGHMSAGKVTVSTSSTENKLQISQVDNSTINYLGGMIGLVTGEISISGNDNSSLEIVLGGDFNFAVNHFGGLVAEVGLEKDISTTMGGLNSNLNISIAALNSSVNINQNISFGGLIADLNSNSKVNIIDDSISLGGEGEGRIEFNVTSSPEQNNTDSGMGGFIGRQLKGSTAEINVSAFNISIISANDNNNENRLGKSNLGGFVGYIESEQFNTNIGSTTDISFGIKLQGTQNVGGLFGWATKLPALKIENDGNGGKTKTYGGYYSGLDGIEIIVKPNSNQGNIGGLIGLFQSADDNTSDGNASENSKVLGVDVNPDDNKPTIVSKAKITFDNASDSGEFYVNNIGGVVGKVTQTREIKNLQFAGIFDVESSATQYDKDIISYVELDSQNKDELSFRANNVGGVIGYIQGVVTTTSDPDTDTTTTTKTQVYNLIHNSIDSTGTSSVYGYQNVGGLIGYAENVDLYNIVDTTNNSGEVYGVINVGGLLGAAQNCTIGADQNSVVDAEQKAYGLKTTGAVYGNYNVGGAIGLLVKGTNEETSSSLIGNTVDIVSEEESAGVKGIPYFVSSVAEDNSLNLSYYLPSNVGGLVGFATHSSLINNQVNAQILSSIEGTHSSSDSNGIVISTVSNYMGQVLDNLSTKTEYINPDPDTNGDATETAGGIYFGVNSGKHLVKFFTITSGYGGLAGALVQWDEVSGNTLNNLSVDAQLGVNVGSLFGYLKNENTNEKDALNNLFNSDAVKITNDQSSSGGITVNVDGGYFIGSLAGYVDLSSSVEFSNSNLKLSDSKLTIEVQNKYTGMYVGGLFGKLSAHDNDVLSIENNSNVDIRLHTEKSYYIGGLLGQYYVKKGTAENWNIDENGVSTGGVKLEGNLPNGGLSGITPTDANSITEFGGFVGMLKVEKSTKPALVTIKIEDGGNQPYAFTVNTIENGNYYDGPSRFDALEQNNDVYLIAQATYVNQDNFIICPTSDKNWYTKVSSESANNPLRPNSSTGWAKEYTMFKTMQRNIPADDNNKDAWEDKNPKWDVVSTVYDASNITYVATQSNSGYTLNYNDNHTPFKKDDYNDGNLRTELFGGTEEDNPDTTTTIDGKDYIICTIYEPVDGEATLYSKIGIATPVKDDDGNYTNPQSHGKNGWQEFLYTFGIRGERVESKDALMLNPPDSAHVPNSVQLMDKINPDIYSVYGYFKIYTGDMDGNTAAFQGSTHNAIADADNTYKTYNYLVPQYYESTSSGRNINKSEKQNTGSVLEETHNLDLGTGTWFEFKYFYEFKYYANNEKKEMTGTDMTPKDGNIFNVTGVYTQKVLTATDGGQPDKALRIVGIIVEVIITAATLGTAALFSGTVRAIIKFVAKLAVKILGNVAISAVVTLLVARSVVNKMLGQKLGQTSYFQVENQTIGLLGMSYQRDITYKNGVLDEQSDTVEYDTYHIYIYYSDSRPSDFYLNQYVLYYEDTSIQNETIYINEHDKSFEKITDIYGKPQIEEDESNDFVGWYKCTYNGADAYYFDTYIYKNGSYYVLANTATVEDIPTQPYFDNQENGKNQIKLDYIESNGNFYVRGSYENGQYTMKKENEWDNYLYLDGDEVKRKKWDPDNNEWIVDDSFTWNDDLGEFKVETSEAFTYVPVKNVNDTDNVIKQNNSKDLYLGYGYMKGAYYTANGNQDIKYSDAQTEGLSKVGKFDLYKVNDEISKQAPDGVEGIDYIKVVYNAENDGITIPTTVYYTFTGIAEDDISANYVLDTSKTGNDYASSLYVNLYPYSFNNPYKIEVSDTKVKDEVYYLIVDKNGLKISNPQGIQHTPTYFYFDGGYITDGNNCFIELVNGDDNRIMLTTDEGQSYYSLYSDKDLKQYCTDAGIDLDGGIPSGLKFITVYDETGNKTEYTYQGFVKDYEKIKNSHYVTNVIDVDNADDKNEYLVSNNYKLSSNKVEITEYDGTTLSTELIYIRDIQYRVKDGNYSYIRLKYKTEGSYNYNKYCISERNNVYTRYWYQGFDLSQEFTSLVDSRKKYYLYNQSSRPNGNRSTHLTESVRVILSGGGTFNNGDSELYKKDIGSITCS